MDHVGKTTKKNRSVAKIFGAQFEQIISQHNGFKRYLYCIKTTYSLLESNRYRLVFVQNPSIILAAIAVILKPLLKYKLVIDAHNAGVRPREGKNVLLQKINMAILRGADCVIVTNQRLMQFLSTHKVSSATVTDPLPELMEPEGSHYTNYIIVLCSWAEDEPIQAYMETAKRMPAINFVFSGNYKKYLAQSEIAALPKNIKLARFVSEAEYVGLLTDAQAVLDLTLRDDCLVCGAYEAIAASKKVILSDTHVNRELFGNAAFYTKNDSAALRDCINQAINTDVTEQIRFFKDGYHL